MALSARLLRPKASGANLDPRSVGPLHCWFDASDSSTIFDADTGGSLPAAGGGIGRINDKSGNGRNATQSTANNRPTYQLGVQGGRPVMRFDGSNDYLATASFAKSAALTWFVVAQATWHNATYRALFNHGYVLPLPSSGVVFSRAGGTLRDWNQYDLITFGNGAGPASAPFIPPRAHGPLSSGTDFRVFAVTLGANLSRHWTNGTVSSTTTETTSAVDTAAGAVGIGGATSSAELWSGDIAEVLYYSTALSVAAIDAVNRYLRYKWSI